MSLPVLPFTFVGVVHLLTLPGGPVPSPGFATVRAQALADAAALAEGGAHAAILENFGDAPFPAGPVDPHVAAFVASLATEIRQRWPGLSLGINLLRNDARSALGVVSCSTALMTSLSIRANTK